MGLKTAHGAIVLMLRNPGQIISVSLDPPWAVALLESTRSPHGVAPQQPDAYRL